MNHDAYMKVAQRLKRRDMGEQTSQRNKHWQQQLVSHAHTFPS